MSATILKTHVAQKEMVATFRWLWSDTLADINGVVRDLGKDTAADIVGGGSGFPGVFDIISLPTNAVITGGYLSVLTAFDTAGYDVKIGDSVTDDRYLASVDRKAVGTSALLTPGYKNIGALPIRISLQNDDACTAGEAILVVKYVIEGRAEEVSRA